MRLSVGLCEYEYEYTVSCSTFLPVYVDACSVFFFICHCCWWVAVPGADKNSFLRWASRWLKAKLTIPILGVECGPFWVCAFSHVQKYVPLSGYNVCIKDMFKCVKMYRILTQRMLLINEVFTFQHTPKYSKNYFDCNYKMLKSNYSCT